jgi:hypothetical protein
MKKTSSVSWQCTGMRLPAGIVWIDIVKAVAGIEPEHQRTPESAKAAVHLDPKQRKALFRDFAGLPELDRRRLVRLPTSRRGSRGAMTARLARRRKIAGPGNEIVRKHRRKPSTGG